MADHHLLLLVLALLLCFLTAAAAPRRAATDSAGEFEQSAKKDEDSDRVLVELYSESLCPYCAQFIVTHLNDFFSNGLIEIVDLRIIPYGNAKMNKDGTFTCQHGPNECKLNIIQTCAINIWPSVCVWFPFIYCLESMNPRSSAAQFWKNCSYTVPNITLVEDCYNSPLGYQLEKAFAEQTNELDPPHTYVPWVLVNGQPLYEDYEEVEKYVCKAYKGKHKPQLCKAYESDLRESG